MAPFVRFKDRPRNVSIRNQLCERGRKIGHNTACPTVLFMEMDGVVWSIDQSGVCVPHDHLAAFLAKPGRVTLY